MKILHVTKKYPDALGGDAIVVSNLEKQQKKSGHQVVILTSNCEEIKNGKHIYKVGIKDKPAALDKISPRRLFSLILLFFQSYKIIKNEKPDVIHTHSVDMAFFISFAARRYRVPIVHSFHIVTFYDNNQSLSRRRTELPLVRYAKPSIITAPNLHDVRKLQKAGLHQVVLLPNGIDLNFWHVKSAIKKSKIFKFVTVGRLEEQKGNEYLIRASALLKQAADKSFEVIIVGEGSLEKSLKQLAIELGVQNKVLFVGRKTASQLRTIYSTADAAVIPSLYETGPLTLLEAWAMNLPTIATPVGVLAEASDNDKSILEINPRCPESLASAMGAIMTNSARLADYAKNKVRSYSWSAMCLALDELYEKA